MALRCSQIPTRHARTGLPMVPFLLRQEVKTLKSDTHYNEPLNPELLL